MFEGRIAGWNAAKTLVSEPLKEFKTVPFFWTMQFGKSIRFVGSLADGFEGIHCVGNPEEFKFEAYYYGKGGDTIVAVATMAADPIAAHCKLLYEVGKMPDLQYIKSGGSVLNIKP